LLFLCDSVSALQISSKQDQPQWSHDITAYRFFRTAARDSQIYTVSQKKFTLIIFVTAFSAVTQFK